LQRGRIRDHGTRRDHNLFARSGLPAKGDAVFGERRRGRRDGEAVLMSQLRCIRDRFRPRP
jgi:hypothetical protein